MPWADELWEREGLGLLYRLELAENGNSQVGDRLGLVGGCLGLIKS